MSYDEKSYSERLKDVASVLKRRFTNLTVEDTINIATEVLAKLEDNLT